MADTMATGPRTLGEWWAELYPTTPTETAVEERIRHVRTDVEWLVGEHLPHLGEVESLVDDFMLDLGRLLGIAASASNVSDKQTSQHGGDDADLG